MDIVEFQIKIDDKFTVVDIDRSTTFPFNLQISDITDPAVSRIPFSSQINIPRTHRNNNLFTQIWKLDRDVLGFNPLTRTEFRLYVNYNLFQSGYVKLEQITLNDYRIRLYGGLGDYFYLASEIRLQELGFVNGAETAFGKKFSHKINRGFLHNVWSGSPYTNESKNDMSKFFAYAMTYQGQYENFDSDRYVNDNTDLGEVSWYNPEEGKSYTNPDLNEHRRTGELAGSAFYGEYRSYYQRPCVAVKDIFLAITSRLEQEGWKTHLDETFFNDSNPYWSDLWMICPPYDITSDQVNTTVKINSSFNTPEIGPSQAFTKDIPISLNALGLKSGETYNILGNIPFRLKAIWHSGNESNSFSKQVGLDYITARLKIGSNVNKLLKYTGNGTTMLRLDTTTLAGKDPGKGKWTGRNFYYQLQDGNGKDYLEKDYQPGSVFEFSFSEEIPKIEGDPSASIVFSLSGSTHWNKQSKNKNDRPMGLVIEFEEGGAVSVASSGAVGSRTDAIITWKDIIQSDETCKDFLLSYGKLFNLHYVKDEATKTVHIITRNTFYKDLERLDWTHKIDYNKDFILEPIPFEYRTGVMRWKNAGTKYEEDYYTKTAKDYGSVRFDTGYQFSDDEKNIMDGIIFSNCVIASDYSPYFSGRTNTIYRDNKAIPHFQDASGSGVDVNYVLAFRDGLKSVDASKRFIITDDTTPMLSHGYAWTTANSTPCTTYPNFTRTVKRNEEPFSLNFGRPSIAYNDDEELSISTDTTVGEETLYVHFWRDYLRDRFSERNKRLTCYVNLTNADMDTYLLNKFIFINNTPWVIDKIQNYSPTTTEPTKVSLISVNDIEAYTAQRYVAGTMTLQYRGEYIYDSSGTLAVQTNPVVIRLEKDTDRISIPMTLSISSLSWSLGEYNTQELTITPLSGTGSTTFSIGISQNDTGSVVAHNIPIRWGSTNTIIQIIQVSSWTVTGTSTAGSVLVNGMESPQEIADSQSAILTVQSDVPYAVAYWIVNSAYHDSEEVNIQVTEDIVAEAVMYNSEEVYWTQPAMTAHEEGETLTNRLNLPSILSFADVSIDVGDANPISGNGTSDISFTIPENATGETRTITVSASVYARTRYLRDISFTITQESIFIPELSVEPESYNVPGEGESYGIEVSSNTEWLATTGEEDTWIALSAGSGTGDQTLTVTVEENDTDGERTAGILFQTADGSLSVTHTVTQEPGPEEEEEE